MTPGSGLPASRLVCSGCGASAAPEDPYPFRCPNSGTGDVDHVLVKVLDPARVRFPDARARPEEREPFVIYRELLHSYHRATAGGVSDSEFVETVRRLDEMVAEVEGHGFVVTPFARDGVLSRRLGFEGAGGIWVKDETGNVAGSHKGRHLMGVLLHVEVSEMLGLSPEGSRPRLAIASCGNAALAAAVLSRAVHRSLRVFVPVGADPAVTSRLDELGAEVVFCPRRDGRTGDPTYLRLEEELSSGAVAFSCQGNLNGLAIEGGETLGYEISSALSAGEAQGALDHLVVQVGGGALASSCIQALGEAVGLGALGALPRVHTVQTSSVHPLERAYRLVRSRLPENPGAAEIDQELRRAAGRRSSFMWAWESEPKSIATGILDDETYDWLAVVGGMLRSGGVPVVVDEERLAEAHELGHEAGYDVDPTGSSSLAGLLELRDRGLVGSHDRVAVLFTGRER